MSTRVIHEWLRKEAHDSLAPSSLDTGLKWRDFRRLASQIIRQHILNDIPVWPYLAVLEIFTEEARKLAPPNQYFVAFDDPAWKGAVGFALDLAYLSRKPADFDLQHLELLSTRVVRTAREVRRLKVEGADSIGVQDGQFSIDNQEMSGVIDTIEDAIRSFGGLNLAMRLFSAISSAYDSSQQRYQLGRRTSPIPKSIQPMLPIGYLLNLCVKHANFPGGCPANEIIPQLFRRAGALGCLYDVQPYSTFELEFKTIDNLTEFLREIALFDSLFTITQLRPDDIPRLLRGLFDWVDDSKARKAFGWTIGEVVTVAETILSLAPPQHTGGFPEPVLCSRIQGIDPVTIHAILDELTHASPGPNESFRTPEQIDSLTFQQRPLLKSGNDYWLMDASWCGPAFYEAIATVLRTKYTKQSDDMIGQAAERFVKSEVARIGLNYLSGEYHHLGMDGECDLVVETADTIIFFELKKKPLTRRARGGSDVHLLLDISDSLLASQIQLGQHEILLRKGGFLDLEGGADTKRLELKGRNIERVSVTVLDYGGIQDRRVISQILRLAMSARFTPTDAQYAGKFEKLNEKCLELRSQAMELDKMGSWHKIPYFNCWFLSIPQILVLLDGVRSGDDLKRALWETRHVTMGTLDFYTELASIRKISRKATKDS